MHSKYVAYSCADGRSDSVAQCESVDNANCYPKSVAECQPDLCISNNVSERGSYECPDARANRHTNEFANVHSHRGSNCTAQCISRDGHYKSSNCSAVNLRKSYKSALTTTEQQPDNAAVQATFGSAVSATHGSAIVPAFRPAIC
jgi:hypothetical protein